MNCCVNNYTASVQGVLRGRAGLELTSGGAAETEFNNFPPLRRCVCLKEIMLGLGIPWKWEEGILSPGISIPPLLGQ